MTMRVTVAWVRSVKVAGTPARKTSTMPWSKRRVTGAATWFGFPWQLGQVGEEHGPRSVVDQPNACDCGVRVVEENLDGVARSGEFDRCADIAERRSDD